jgi:thioester reductase-like protein
MSSGDVLLTGATGFVGMELLARYLERSERNVIALVRASDDAGARARIDAVLDDVFGDRADGLRGRVRAVAADVTTPRLGITDAVRDEIAERSSTIVHSAASVSFTLSLSDARGINTEGTRRMLELATLAEQRGGLDCYGQVSTAFVAGDHAGHFAESDRNVGQTFHNSYEQSKFESEELVAASDLPTRVMRPSIVVGDRTSGWTAAFNVLYWPLRAFSRGLFDVIPANPGAPVDVVPIDYVADGVYALCGEAGVDGQTYHLTAGRHASTMAELGELASRYFHRPPPRVVTMEEFAELPPQSAAVQQAFIAGAAYFPYFAMTADFDDSVTRAALEPGGMQCSPLSQYIERLLDFATLSRWGKVTIPRCEALAEIRRAGALAA